MTFAPPGERNVAMVFQNYALYPHMTLEQNIGFPLRMDGVPRAEIAERVREAARRVRIDHLLARRPGQLSGGQQQRCALARAIVRQPRLFLLDEPLSNLDAQLRLETRIELKRLHSSLGVTTIYVTHDQEEAMTIADRMAVFREGEIMQIGTPEEVFGLPDTLDVAAFIGSPPMNLIPARIEDGAAVFPGWRLPLPGAPVAGDVVVGLRPGRLRLADDGLPGQAPPLGEPRRGDAPQRRRRGRAGQGAASRGPPHRRRQPGPARLRFGGHPPLRRRHPPAHRLAAQPKASLMKTVFLLFNSVNRLMLEPYGGQLLETPNFKRLAERSVTFDNHYIGSMPCMPARRDMQTGHLSFLHRSWGPLEPFDNSFPELLKTAGAYSHLISDHYHYWEDGGATYHTRYNSFEFIRGQESDPWKVLLDSPIERIRAKYHPSQNDPNSRQNPYNYMINREFIKEEKDFPSVQCFDAAFDFLDRNRGADNWLLQVETFDPHEPFFAPERLKAKFPTDYDGPILDWPRYERVSEPQDQIDELRANYFALLTLCDELLGRMLDYFDEHDLWKDTALILTTDHGFLLGEHDWWAKNRMPLYEEISHIPLFVHHPAFAGQAGTRRNSLTQTIDLMPTFCELFGADDPGRGAGQVAPAAPRRRRGRSATPRSSATGAAASTWWTAATPGSATRAT